VGRDPTQITRSANTPLLITTKPEERERLVVALMQRFGRSEADARDTVLAGSVAQIQDTIGRLQDVGVDQIFVPTSMPPWNLDHLDRIITDIAPVFR
jgi:alkanesulfonate monooxygenase SsuD/methylene tetrahydromethanopterin reductase-like flavin-dependent oxidoreductase (luciferase family)